MPTPRIISGSAKGMHLKDVPGNSTRPIMDRVKEALFNILAYKVYDADFLDLFGGTGSVGIEALSRGARWVDFIEINSLAVRTIKLNLLHTRLAENCQVYKEDAFRFLQNCEKRYDLIFIAPPQYKQLWEKALQMIDSRPHILKGNGLVIVQIDPLEYKKTGLINLSEHDQRKYGNTLLVFYELMFDPLTTTPPSS
jgi:16S rRNA (guanine966-N2)-methyltransferase